MSILKAYTRFKSYNLDGEMLRRKINETRPGIFYDYIYDYPQVDDYGRRIREKRALRSLLFSDKLLYTPHYIKWARDLETHRGNKIVSPTVSSLKCLKARHLPKRHLELLSKWRQKVEDYLNFMVDTHIDVKATVRENSQVGGLLEGIEYHDIATDPDDSEYTTINLTFPPNLIFVGKDKYFSGASTVRIKLNLRKQYAGVDMFPVDLMINPHVSHGNGGSACTGDFDYALALSAKKRNWFELLFTLLEFNKTVDTSDSWGKHIRNLPKEITTIGDKITGTTSEIASDIFNVTWINTANYLINERNNKLYSKEQYEKCWYRGNIVKKGHKIGVTTGISPETLKELSVESIRQLFHITGDEAIAVRQQAKDYKYD